MKTTAIDIVTLTTKCLIRATAIAIVAATAGCNGTSGILPTDLTFSQSDKDKKAVATDTHVVASGDGFALGDVERPALLPQQFVDRMGEHLRSGRTYNAQRLVQLFPDVALSVLRDPKVVNVPPDILIAIADAHDQQCQRGNEPSWAAVARERAAQPACYAEFDNKRHEFMHDMQAGRVKDAQKLGLAVPRSTAQSVLAIDVLNLNGIALVLDNRPREAVTAFQQALQAAGSSQPYEAVNLMLLLSDAQRRSGDFAAAEQTWITAAETATELASAAIPVLDPILLERTAYLRPAASPWPRQSQRRLNDLSLVLGIVFPGNLPQITTATQANLTDEAPLWTVVGHCRLARNEAQAALVALKRAESMSTGPLAAGRLQLAEAQVLVRLGQAPAASAMLINLAGQRDPQISRPAMAVLGALKLREGNVQQGFNLLQSAVEREPTVLWPDRTQAEADLGLAYLMMGDEPAGLRFLHGAQQSFESAGRHDDLVQCLENEAAYLDQAKKQDLAKEVRKRLEGLATSASRVAGT